MKRLKTLIPKLAFVAQNGTTISVGGGSSKNEYMNPYVDSKIGIITRNRQKSINAGEESVKSHHSSSNSIGRLRAATMMKHTKVVPTTKVTPNGDATHTSIFSNVRKGSYDVGSRNAGNVNTQTHNAKHQGRDSGLTIQDTAFHLPNLGKTVSHSMTPANIRKVNNALLRPTDEDEQHQPEDSKLMDLVAKSAFLKVDERTMKAFRDQGRTPTLARSNVEVNRRGDFATTEAPSPLSYRSNDIAVAGRNKMGYLGTYQDQ